MLSKCLFLLTENTKHTLFFECGFMCSSDEDAKSFGKNFTQALINFLRYYQEIDDNISTFGLDIHRD